MSSTDTASRGWPWHAGRLRVYLGAAPGVGKTYAMLGEGHRRAERGTDVVVGFVETHGRPHTAEHARRAGDRARARRSTTAAPRSPRWTSTRCSPAAPRSRWSTSWRTPTSPAPATRSAGRTSRSCSTPASTSSPPSTSSTWSPSTTSSRRSPASRSANGSRTPWCAAPTRSSSSTWRRRRCAAGWRTATSTRPRRSTPPWATTSGVGNLTALRELALLWTADKVDEALQRYRAEHDIEGTWEARERVVVALTGGPEGETLIRRAARIAARSSGGDLLAVHVTRSDGLTGASPADLAAQRQLVETLGGTYHQVVGDDVAEALLTFARAENATQLVLGGSRRVAAVGAVLRVRASAPPPSASSGDIDVHIVTHCADRQGPRSASAHGSLTRRRRLQGFVLAVLLPPLLTLVLVNARERPQPRQRRAAVPAGRRRGRAGRRILAGDAGRGRRGRCC